MKEEIFGKSLEGDLVKIFELSSEFITARIMNYGGILVSLLVPDEQGVMGDVVMGFDEQTSYLGPHPSFGTINGRYANRIAKGKFSIGENSYQLAINNKDNHLHGGIKGFDKVIWQAQPFVNERGEDSLKLTYRSPDGEEGYPGNLDISVTYVATKDQGLKIEYLAQSDQPTVLNLTNHSYFNLSGSCTVLDHDLCIYADFYTPTDEQNIPSGEILSVANTAFDFRSFKKIGIHIDNPEAQLQYGSGYDHNFVLRGEQGSFRKIAELKESSKGRHMEVYSTLPGVQLYTANHVKGVKGKSGNIYGPREAVCLETQHFPDSPNHPHFPSTLLKPGQNYKHKTEYRFLN